MSNPIDNTYAIVRQTAEGVDPVTPAFVYLDNNDANVLNLSSKTLTPSSMKSNRAMVAAGKTSFYSTLTLKAELCRHPGYEMLLENSCGNTFSSGTMKGSNVDTFHNIEKTFSEAGTTFRMRGKDMTVSKMQLTSDTGAYAMVTYTLQGTKRDTGVAVYTGATYTDPVHGPYMQDADVGSISVGGLTAVYTSLDLSIDQARDAKLGLGSKFAFGTGAKGPRQIKLTLKLFRKDLSPETLFTPDTPVNVSFQIGAAGTGYGFQIPAAVSTTVPTSDDSGSSAMVTVELMATLDATTGTDIIVTKL